MPIPCKALRRYQERLITDVRRADGDVLVEQPTGSGKTMQIVTLVAMDLGRRFTHALISAPQAQIEHGFVHRDYCRVDWLGAGGVAVPSVQVPDDLILPSRKSELGSVKQIRSYLRMAGSAEHALACTHAALNRLTPEDLPVDLSGKALFLDEAHHASADGLSQIVSLWRDRGGQLFFFTATPYRGDGRPVALDGMRLFRRSLAEHMAEGFAPGHLESEIVALGHPGDAITSGIMTGEEALPSSYIEPTVTAICRRWLVDGRPKAIVRVPPMRRGQSAELVIRLIQALSTEGARVLDATGTGVGDQQRFLAALEAEKTRPYAASAFDIMVGIQRVLEGTDWPVCSAVYCVGMPGSLNTVVQFLGRAMRQKGEDYPAAHRDRARLVFFVPCAGGSSLADLSLDHSRHALLTCCFLADHEVGQEWIVLREVRRGIEAALGSPTENPAAADAENEANEALDPEVRAEIELAMASAREQIIGVGGEPTLGEIVQLTARSRPDLPEAALQRVATEILATGPGSTGAAVREVIRQEVLKRLRIDPMVKRAMAEAFAVVLDGFRGVTLKDSVVLESVGRQVHGVTGGQMREFAQRLRDAAPRPLTEEQIIAWADAHRQHSGEWPNVSCGTLRDVPDETWRGLDGALRNGSRGLEGNSSLASLLAEKRGVRNPKDLPMLTEEQILAWADAFNAKSQQWPTRNSGEVEEAPGETWAGVENALFRGTRSLAGGSSLAKLLAERRGVRNLGDLPSLSVQQILAWADAHHFCSGEWPGQDSGDVIGVPGEKWQNINAVLRIGLRGLPGGSSLALLIAEHRAVRNPSAPPALTKEQILAWADAHHERTGQWPKQQSGSIPEASGESWTAVELALSRGRRGLPGGSSIAQLLAAERGVRNHLDLPSLSVEQILKWADAHHQRTGQWPRSDPVPIVDAPGETWRIIDSALKNGSRGLPGDSSLARLLNLHREVKNRKSLPHLTVKQILEWADAYHDSTGAWPTSNTGAIANAPGETWKAVDMALIQGGRGLPSGGTLARLLAVERGARNPKALPALTIGQILAWADAHHERTGKWPTQNAGPIADAPGETWGGIGMALHKGRRGLPKGLSLARLTKEHRSVQVS
jgi:hypothetical protein